MTRARRSAHYPVPPRPEGGAVALRVTTALTGHDEDQLLALLVPQLPPASGRPLAAVPDDPATIARHIADAERRRAVEELLAKSVPENTRRSYASHIRAWAAYCRERDIAALPADPVHVAEFLAAYAIRFRGNHAVRDEHGQFVQGRAAASLSVRTAAIYRIHINAGLPTPTDDPAVQNLQRAVHRAFTVRPTNAKGAVDRAMLASLLEVAGRGQPGHLRRWALVLLHASTGAGIAAASALQWSDIDLDGQTIQLRLRTGRTVERAIPDDPDPRLSLAATLSSLREQAPHLRQVFVSDTGQPITRQSLHEILVHAEERIGPLREARAVRLLVLHRSMVDAGRAKPLRDTALLTCGWWAALRRSELSDLRWSDLTRRKDGNWQLWIRRSKTDQAGHGVALYLVRLADGTDPTCPVRALEAWHDYIRCALGTDPITTHPEMKVFACVDRYGRLRTTHGKPKPLPGNAVNTLVQQLIADAGLETKSGGGSAFGGHSLRAGFVTEAFRGNKMTAEEVQQITRHKSLDVLMRYRREILSFENSPIHRLVSALDLGDD